MHASALFEWKTNDQKSAPAHTAANAGRSLAEVGKKRVRLHKAQSNCCFWQCWHIYSAPIFYQFELNISVDGAVARLRPVFCLTRKRMLLMDLVVYVKGFRITVGNFISLCIQFSKVYQKQNYSVECQLSTFVSFQEIERHHSLPKNFNFMSFEKF